MNFVHTGMKLMPARLIDRAFSDAVRQMRLIAGSERAFIVWAAAKTLHEMIEKFEYVRC
jgi:hypothetical protein